ncbi:hypothetical protein GL50803_00137751 [Giardia duodenalis]|uniref:Uncharacterized protein n=1 Tax=Giardia intestinalis (strain ATCC 50803 / WB clone C6) TaxID=184922 RepID=A0A644F435_GIAIC|nr:hypothetical protein GL50803_00137751 [Giardia intestinalis]KAE8303182.1 hypothetical protein GL50803_00137751 [Giardia intestinalis]
MESPRDLRRLWDCILAMGDNDVYYSEACTGLIVTSFYGEKLQMVLKYLRDKFFSYTWSTLESFSQDDSAHTRITALKGIIKYSRTVCSSMSFIHSHYCKELLVDLLTPEAKDASFSYNSKDLLSPIYNRLCTLRELYCPSALRGASVQRPNLYIEGIRVATTPIKEVLLLYSELSPNHKEEVQEMVEGALLFDADRYLLDFTEFVSVQLNAPLGCHAVELFHRLSIFEEEMLSALHQILPVESKFDPAQTLARVCNAAICLGVKMHPERHWEGIRIIVDKLVKEEIPVCSTMVSFMDHTILAFIMNKRHREFVDIMTNIVCRGLTAANDVQCLFRSLFRVDTLTNHTGVHYAKLLDTIHNRLNSVISNGSCSIKEQIGLYAAAFINFHHVRGEMEALTKIMPHKPLFFCKLFEERILLDLFSRMTALRLGLTFMDQHLDKLSYILAELELFTVLASIFTPCLTQLYAYVLTISTGCREARQIEAKSKALYAFVTTSGWKSSMPKIAGLIATLVQPVTSSNVEIGFSNIRLPETVKTALCEARFAAINVGADDRLRVVREDCLRKLTRNSCDTDCLNQLVSAGYFYVSISPEDMNFPLKLTDSLSNRTRSDNNTNSNSGNKEPKKLEIMARLSRMVKTSGRISVEDLVNACHEHYKATSTITKSEISDIVQRLTESDVLEWTGEKMLQWHD